MAKTQRKQRSDLRANIVITVVAQNAVGERIRGNVTKSYKVNGSTVTAVASALERVFVKSEQYTLKQ